jgi:uncharacterized membrane protein
MDYTIPYYHPIAAHFPVALLVVAAAAALVWLVRSARFWGQAALLLSALGAVGAVAAYRTGEAIRYAREGAPIVEELVGRHELLAKWTIAAALASTLVLGALLWRTRPNGQVGVAGRAGAALVCGTAAALVIWGSHLGGLMTWGVPAG